MARIHFHLVALLASGILALLWDLSSSCRAVETSKAEKTGSFRDACGDVLPVHALQRLGTLRFRQPGGISALAYSPDGKALAAASKQGNVSLLDTVKGTELRHFNVKASSPIEFLRFSNDGKLLLWIERSADHPICVWNVATGKRLMDLPVSVYAKAASFSPNGKYLAIPGYNGAVELWDLATGKKYKEFGKFRDCAGVEYSPDGKNLAVCDIKIHLLDAETGKELMALEAVDGGYALAFSRDSKTLAFSSWEGSIQVWSLAHRKKICLLQPAPSKYGVPGTVNALAFSPGGKWLIAAQDGEPYHLRVWDLAKHKLIRLFPWSTRGSLVFALSPDGKTLAAADVLGSAIRFWNVKTGQPTDPIAGHWGAVSPIGFSRDGSWLWSAGNGSVRTWETRTGKERWRLETWDSRVEWPDPEGRFFYVHTEAGLSPRALPVGRLLACRPGKDFFPTARSPDGKRWAVRGHWDKHYFLDLPESPQEVALQKRKPLPAGVVFPVEDRWLVTLGNGRTIVLWPQKGGQKPRGLRHCGSCDWVAFSRDGSRLITVRHDSAQIWDAATGKELVGKDERNYSAVCPEGLLMAVAESYGGSGAPGADPAEDQDIGRIRLADLVTGQTLAILPHPLHGNCPMAFSRDGRNFAVGYGNGSIRVYEVATGLLRQRFSGHRDEITGLVFSDDGRLLASGSKDTTLLIWDLTGRQTRSAKSLKLGAPALNQRWQTLAGWDAARASQAQWDLVACPETAVSFLRRELRPIVPVDARSVDRWIADLNNPRYLKRQHAEVSLTAAAFQAEAALRKVLGNRTLSAETRRSIERLLKKLTRGVRGPGERLRQLRAIEVLERIGNADARRLLEELSRGAKTAELTREAQAAFYAVVNRARS